MQLLFLLFFFFFYFLSHCLDPTEIFRTRHLQMQLLFLLSSFFFSPIVWTPLKSFVHVIYKCSCFFSFFFSFFFFLSYCLDPTEIFRTRHLQMQLLFLLFFFFLFYFLSHCLDPTEIFRTRHLQMQLLFLLSSFFFSPIVWTPLKSFVHVIYKCSCFFSFFSFFFFLSHCLDPTEIFRTSHLQMQLLFLLFSSSFFFSLPLSGPH